MNIGELDVGTGISAAGTTQATAQLLISGISTVTTVAAGAGVRLQVGLTGANQIVYNSGANPLSIYPPVGYAINALALNAAHLLAPNTACVYWVASSTLIIGTPLGDAVASVGTAISAAGTTQATATALTSSFNAISVAAASSGVALAGGTGYSQTVYNGGANQVKVYPPVGAQINNLGTNNAALLPTNTACTYYAVSATQIIGVLSA